MSDAPEAQPRGPVEAKEEGRPRRRAWRARLIAASTFPLCVLLGEVFCRSCMQVPLLGNSRDLFVAEAFGESAGNRKSSVQSSFGVRVHIDGLGFRVDPDHPDVNSDEAVLLLGDSVAFGAGVEERDTLAGKLRRDLAGVRLYNSAVIGYATTDYANVVEHFVPAHPEVQRALVLLCLNDVATTSARQIQRSLEARQPGSGEAGGIERLRGTWFDSVNSALRSRSKLYICLKAALTDPQRRYFEADLANYAAEGGVFEPGMRPLLRVRDRLVEHGVDLTVVILPYAAQVRTRPPADTRPQEMIADFLERNGIEHLDATAFFASRDEDLFLFGDPMHLSPAGHGALHAFLTPLVLGERD